MNHVFRLIWSRTQESLVPVPEGVTARGRGRRHLRRVRRIIRKTLSPGEAAAVLMLLGLAPAAQALPTGGSVVAGRAQINQGADQTTITQQSARAILDWKSFGIGAGQTVTFRQPSTASIALNRVTGSDASQIYGHLHANGQVFLVNPNGIYFAPGAQVDVGGIVASTLGVNGSDFMAGKALHFRGDSTAGVDNDGTVRAENGGYVAFIGRHVTNDGTIATPGGTAALGAGGAVDLTLAGNSLLSFQVSAAALDAEVRNGGAIRAGDGRVVLSAQARDALMQTVVNNTGTIEARGVRKTAGGAIQLLGGNSGMVAVAGTLNASSARGHGGAITVTGAHVLAGAGARLLATGATGGGTIAFGGGWNGAGGARTQSAKVASSAVLDASATGQGNGGTISVWSSLAESGGQTLSFGSLLARGGPHGGNGGRIETSGHSLDVTGTHVDTSAPEGAAGEWLLDPYNVTISSAADKTSTGFTASGTNSVVNVSTLENALASNNVTVSTGTGGSQAGDITVANGMSWSSANTLTLDAYHSINIDAPISVTGSGGLALHFNDGGTGGNSAVNAPVNLTSTSSFSTQNGSAAAISYTIIDSLGAAGSTTATDLQGISGNLAGHYALGANIDASATSGWNTNAGFAPIGNQATRFTGTFDGLGHVISTLTINRPSASYVGLFGDTEGATLRDVGLLGGSVTGGNDVGGLVGANTGNATITNAYATGSVTGNGFDAGGLVGLNTNATITNAHATGKVTGDFEVGGLVGLNIGATITNAYATGSVNGSGSNVGGLVGSNNGLITNAYATGSVNGSNNVGGLVGSNNAPITNAYATGSENGSRNVGGLVGWNNALITNAYATGSVTGSSNVGGLVGLNYFNNTITDGYWNSSTTGASSGVGGGSSSGTSGATTALLASGTLAGLNNSSWSTSGNQTTPWLTANESFGTVSGHVILGTDTSAKPTYYDVIATLPQLQNINTTGLGGSYALGANIDASATSGWNTNAGFAPIGNQATPFTGTFDGLGHVISTLTINRPSASYVGLFGDTEGATLRDVGLLGGSVRGSNNIGGLVGANYNATISNAYATGSVTGNGYDVGGLIGANYNATISNAYATGGVTGNGYDIGGLIGWNNATITNAYAAGSVTGGGNYVGGLVGFEFNAAIMNAYATGSVAGGGSYVGGLVGFNFNGLITNAYATGSATGSGNVGGLVGLNTGTITDGYWNTSTTGASSGVGGGSNSGTSGATTALLASGTLAGLNNSSWSTSGNQTTPWLTANESFGTFSGHVILGTDTSAMPTYYDVIATLPQLQNINTTGLGGSYALGTNIDASATSGWNTNAGFAPIGSQATPFTGTFDGLGHVISNLTINRPSTFHVGLFGYTAGAMLRDVGLLGGSVTGGNDVGGLVGANTGNATITNAYATGSVTGSVTGNGFDAGGLVGWNSNATITNAHATGKVTGGFEVGGLVGSNTSNATITNAYATGSVTGSGNYVGGLIGASTRNATIMNAYATGSVTGSSYVSGLAGWNSGATIKNAYATGSVTGSSYVSGLVGGNSGATITNAYATGSVTGSGNYVGGLVGWNSNGTITDGYWNTSTTGVSNGVGLGLNSGASGATTSALQASLQTGFSTTTWGINAGVSYPYFKWRFPSGPSVISGAVTGVSGGNGSLGLSAAVDGTVVATTHTGANGYYNVMVDPQTAGSEALTWLDGTTISARGSAVGAMPASASGFVQGQATGLDIRAGDISHSGTETSLSAVATAFDTAKGSLSDSNILYTLSSGQLTPDANAGVWFDLTGASFTLDQSLALTGTGQAMIQSTGGLALGAGTTLSSAASGDAVRLASGGAFSNNAGSGAISTTNGRWLVYLGAPTGGHSYGGLDSGNTAVWSTAALGAVSASGDRYVFSFQPTLDFTALDRTKTYGDTLTFGSVLGTDYSVTGLEPRVNEAYLGDTAATAISGAPALTSAGAAATAGVVSSPYAIAIGLSGVTGLNGYAIGSATAGTLTVTPRNITVTADSQSRTYGDANPALTWTVGGLGLVNGDTLSGALATSATTASNVGAYAITQGTLATSSNYDLTSFTPGTLTVTPRALTGSLATGSSTYGDALAPGAATFANLVAGDSVTATVAVDTSGNTSTSGHLNAGSYTGIESVASLSGTDAGNYTIGSFSGGDYTVGQRVLSATITGNPTKLYDQTTLARLVPGDFALTGLASGDGFNVTQTKGTYATANVGTAIPVRASLAPADFSGVNGTEATNYVLPAAAIGTGTIRSLGLNSIALSTHESAITWLPVVPSTGGLRAAAPLVRPNLTIEGGGVDHKGKGQGPT